MKSFFFLNCFWWNRSIYCLHSPLLPLRGQPTAKCLPGCRSLRTGSPWQAGDCWIRTQDCSFKNWCRYQWATTAPWWATTAPWYEKFCWTWYLRQYTRFSSHSIPGSCYPSHIYWIGFSSLPLFPNIPGFLPGYFRFSSRPYQAFIPTPFGTLLHQISISKLLHRDLIPSTVHPELLSAISGSHTYYTTLPNPDVLSTISGSHSC